MNKNKPRKPPEQSHTTVVLGPECLRFVVGGGVATSPSSETATFKPTRLEVS